MSDLKTMYMGLEIKNPIIVGSCGLTGNLDSIKKMAAAGASAVVLKSLFEEQIMMEVNKNMGDYNPIHGHTEMYDYQKYFEKQHVLEKYLQLIKDAKQEVDIPIIASINCMSSAEWTKFAKDIERAGADALELNIFLLPSDPKMEGKDNEKVYFDIIKKVTSEISIPISIKISHYFDNLANTLQRFSQTKIKGMVLFNRFYNTDIDIEKEELIGGNFYSTPDDMSNTLRWIGIMNGLVDCDLCATNGIHSGKDAIKFLLAGASAVQMVSSIYINSADIIEKSLHEIKDWMEKHNYESIDQFRGKLSKSSEMNTALYERVQFMKYFGSKKK